MRAELEQVKNRRLRTIMLKLPGLLNVVVEIQVRRVNAIKALDNILGSLERRIKTGDYTLPLEILIEIIRSDPESRSGWRSTLLAITSTMFTLLETAEYIPAPPLFYRMFATSDDITIPFTPYMNCEMLFKLALAMLAGIKELKPRPLDKTPT